MHKGKKLWIAVSAVLLAALLAVTGWVIWSVSVKRDRQEAREQYRMNIRELVEKSRLVDRDEESGLVYINNEILLFAEPDADPAAVEAFLKTLDAQVDDSMGDLGIYRLIYDAPMTARELEALCTSLEESPLVETAELNPVLELTEGSMNAVFPNDPWDGSDWDDTQPAGGNWGLEAIDAPGAWAYLDQMTPVHVGEMDLPLMNDHEDLQIPDSQKTLFLLDDNNNITKNSFTVPDADHGTHVAGTIAGLYNNGVGVTGVTGGMGSLYYAYTYMEVDGEPAMFCNNYSYFKALEYLIEQDACAINISMGLDDAMCYAATVEDGSARESVTYNAKLLGQSLRRLIDKRQREGKQDFVLCVSAGNGNDTYFFPDEESFYGYRSPESDWELTQCELGLQGEIGVIDSKYNSYLSAIEDPVVRDRILVVGSAGYDPYSRDFHCFYSSFSNIGSAVDITGPGEWIYSCTLPEKGGYEYMSGTSMAAPHVTGVAGLVFACNPDLTGPQVKDILCSTATGRFEYLNGHSGLVNARAAVEKALQTRAQAPEEPVGEPEGIDLCFVVDTTRSMGDDIDSARRSMTDLLDVLEGKEGTYRVALVDYRDLPDRTGESADYAARVQLDFTGSRRAIQAVIDDLELGYGGDGPETVYSGLMAAAGLDWRPDARKILVLLGDDCPLDPEPDTGYTYDAVLEALAGAGIGIDPEASDERVLDGDCLPDVNVFAISAAASWEGEAFFRQLADDTGGSAVSVARADQVGPAVVTAVQSVPAEPFGDVRLDFGSDLSNTAIWLHAGDNRPFLVQTDSDGCVTLEELRAGPYEWSADGLRAGGTISVRAGRNTAQVRHGSAYWFTPATEFCRRHLAAVAVLLALWLCLCALVPLVLHAAVPRCREAARARAIRREQRADEAEEKKQKRRRITCPGCGTRNPGDAAFCRRCGRLLREEVLHNREEKRP